MDMEDDEMLDEMFDDDARERDNGADNALDAVMKAVKEMARDEIKAKIASLEKENAELRQYRDNALEMAEKRRELERAIENARREAKRARLKELTEPFMAEAWGVYGRYEYIHGKCSLCDDERKRHFTSPLGREMKEDCVCAEKKHRYSVESVEVVKVNGIDDGSVWYYFILPSVDKDDLYSARIYSGQDFAKIENSYRILFLDKETAQNYADYLNSKDEKY